MRSVGEEVVIRLQEKVIPELLSKLENEIPQTGQFENVSVCFDIPYRVTVGKIQIVYGDLNKYPMLRRLDVDVIRRDTGAACSIPLKVGTNEKIKELLSDPSAAETLATKCRYALKNLVEDDDEIYETDFDEIWNRKNCIESQFCQRHPLTEEAQRLLFDLKSASTREALYKILDNAVEQYGDCKYIYPNLFQGFGLRVEVTRSAYTQMKDAETGRPIVDNSWEIIPLSSGVCAVVQYTG